MLQKNLKPRKKEKAISSGIRKQISDEEGISSGLTKELGKEKAISSGIRKQISEKELIPELKKLPEGSIVLIETKPEKYSKITLDILKFLTEKDIQGIILSLNKSYSILMDLYKKNNINTTKIFVLDFVSKSQIVKEKGDNVLYMENATNLTSTSLALNKISESIGGKKVVIIDSISTLLIHNTSATLIKFINHILTDMRKKQIGCFLISFEDERNKEVRTEIVQLCDKIIKV